MILDFHLPIPPLQDYIHSITCYQGYSGITKYEMLLPDGKPQLIFTLDDEPRVMINEVANKEGESRLATSWLTGFHTKPITYQSEQNASTLSIQFKMHALEGLLRIPANAITNQVVDTELILGKDEISELRDKLINANSFKSRVDYIEKFFLKRLTKEDYRKDLVTAILNRQSFNHESLKMWSCEYRLSQKHLLSTFNKVTGTTPKRIQTVMRVNKAIRLLDQNTPSVQVAHACDFYDQTHFIKKFKEITRMTPGEYLKRNRSYPHVINLE